MTGNLEKSDIPENLENSNIQEFPQEEDDTLEFIEVINKSYCRKGTCQD